MRRLKMAALAGLPAVAAAWLPATSTASGIDRVGFLLAGALIGVGLARLAGAPEVRSSAPTGKPARTGAATSTAAVFGLPVHPPRPAGSMPTTESLLQELEERAAMVSSVASGLSAAVPPPTGGVVADGAPDPSPDASAAPEGIVAAVAVRIAADPVDAAGDADDIPTTSDDTGIRAEDQAVPEAGSDAPVGSDAGEGDPVPTEPPADRRGAGVSTKPTGPRTKRASAAAGASRRSGSKAAASRASGPKAGATKSASAGRKPAAASSAASAASSSEASSEAEPVAPVGAAPDDLDASVAATGTPMAATVTDAPTTPTTRSETHDAMAAAAPVPAPDAAAVPRPMRAPVAPDGSAQSIEALMAARLAARAPSLDGLASFPGSGRQPGRGRHGASAHRPPGVRSTAASAAMTATEPSGMPTGATTARPLDAIDEGAPASTIVERLARRAVSESSSMWSLAFADPGAGSGWALDVPPEAARRATEEALRQALAAADEVSARDDGDVGV